MRYTVKRTIAIFLSMLMIVSSLPLSALADVLETSRPFRLDPESDLGGYTVRFLVDDVLLYEAKDVGFGVGADTLIPAENPTKDGYIFEGWRNDHSEDIGVVTVMRDETFHAQFSAIYQLEIRYQYADNAGSVAGQTAAESYHASYKAGDSFSVNTPKVTGYTASQAVVSGMMGTKDQLYTITYSPSSVNYTVHHMQQNVVGEGYTLADTVPMTGSAGSFTEAVAKYYEGFYPLAVHQATIAADGSTVVEIRYHRAEYAINFNTGVGGKSIDPIAGRFGAPVTGIQTKPADITRPGYTFLGWDWNGDGSYNESSDKAPTVFPSRNINVNAVWKANTSTYKIVYWAENANDDGYSWLATISKTGTTGTQPSAGYLSNDSKNAYYHGNGTKAQDFNWTTLNNYFTAKSMDNASKRINGDGTTVVNVYYARKAYDLIFRTAVYNYDGKSWQPSNNYHTIKSYPKIKYMQDIRDIWLTYASAPVVTNPKTEIPRTVSLARRS